MQWSSKQNTTMLHGNMVVAICTVQVNHWCRQVQDIVKLYVKQQVAVSVAFLSNDVYVNDACDYDISESLKHWLFGGQGEYSYQNGHQHAVWRKNNPSFLSWWLTPSYFQSLKEVTFIHFHHDIFTLFGDIPFLLLKATENGSQILSVEILSHSSYKELKKPLRWEGIERWNIFKELQEVQLPLAETPRWSRILFLLGLVFLKNGKLLKAYFLKSTSSLHKSSSVSWIGKL